MACPAGMLEQTRAYAVFDVQQALPGAGAEAAPFHGVPRRLPPTILRSGSGKMPREGSTPFRERAFRRCGASVRSRLSSRGRPLPCRRAPPTAKLFEAATGRAPSVSLMRGRGVADPTRSKACGSAPARIPHERDRRDMMLDSVHTIQFIAWRNRSKANLIRDFDRAKGQSGFGRDFAMGQFAEIRPLDEDALFFREAGGSRPPAVLYPAAMP